MVRVMLLTILMVLHAAFGIPDLLQHGTYWQRALSYSFFHGSWWHFAVNGIAILTIYNQKRPCKPIRDLLFPYLIAVAVYPLSLRPAVGFSNVLYATLGLRTPTLSSPWWLKPSVITFFVVTVALVFVPQFSATTHIAAFLLGMAGSALNRYWLKIKQDARRYL